LPIHKSSQHDSDNERVYRDKRSLPVSDEVVERLRKYGYNIVSDDEAVILGANLLPPWRRRPSAAVTATTDKSSPEAVPTNSNRRIKIVFREKFDLVELDAFGHVIDKGDDDFTPSKSWVGRKAGFEFKVGERGLGYYRTGKKVTVPSNTAY
jgi:hypothetical protein